MTRICVYEYIYISFNTLDPTSLLKEISGVIIFVIVRDILAVAGHIKGKLVTDDYALSVQ